MPPTSVATGTVEGLLRLVGSRAAMAEIAPHLPLNARGTAPGHRAPDAADERIWLAREGFAVLKGLAAPEVGAALVRGVEALRARDLPALFVYAFDDPWAIGEAVCERVSAVVGHDYRLVEDVWAWHIPPGSGRGWPAHRGISHARLDRDAPEVINVWVALSDVRTERACMHAVPLDDDPSYPIALDRLDAPLGAVRAMPADAGDALFWNANLLHWGGRCSARAIGPRVSCSFTLCRADATTRFPDLGLLAPPQELDLTARMDLLARMILVYGEGQHDVSVPVREWATLTHALSSRFGQRKAP